MLREQRARWCTRASGDFATTVTEHDVTLRRHVSTKTDSDLPPNFICALLAQHLPETTKDIPDKIFEIKTIYYLIRELRWCREIISHVHEAFRSLRVLIFVCGNYCEIRRVCNIGDTTRIRELLFRDSC